MTMMTGPARGTVPGVTVARSLPLFLLAALVDTGDTITPSDSCTASGLAVSYKATLPKNINGVWDRTIVYDANVKYVDRDFADTTVHYGRYADSYSAHMTLAPGEAARGRTIEIFIHYFRNGGTDNGSQVQTQQAIIHTC
jgi:hypothetical protein